MRVSKPLLALLVLGVASVGNAWADRGRVHFGVVIGPGWGPWYYPGPYPYYYSPPYYPPVLLQQPPQVYVQQPPMATATPAASNVWYYCSASRSYYPYVKDCPGGWQTVTPQPPQ